MQLWQVCRSYSLLSNRNSRVSRRVAPASTNTINSVVAEGMAPVTFKQQQQQQRQENRTTRTTTTRTGTGTGAGILWYSMVWFTIVIVIEPEGDWVTKQAIRIRMQQVCVAVI